jgi:hypothetical protein
VTTRYALLDTARRVARILAAAAISTLLAAPLRAQDIQRDVLAGHVTGPAGPVRGAVVSVTNVGAPQGTPPQNARTDVEGRWLLAVQEGTGSYNIRVTAIGMKPAETTAKRGEPRKPIIVDVVLVANPAVLDTMKVVVQQRPRTPPELVAQDRAGAAADRFINDFGGAIAVADQGNLAAMASSIPGITLSTDATTGIPSFSVLGLSGDQNRITMNGLSFGGGDVPRDAIADVRVTPITYDVSRGGFSGGQLSVLTYPGGNFHTRLLHATLDERSFQFTDATGRRLGAPYANTQISGAAAGPIISDHLFYNTSLQIGRKTSDLQSLLTSDPLAWERIGIAQDSVSQALRAASALGIPASVSLVPPQQTVDNVSGLARVDWLSSSTQGPPDRSFDMVVSARHNNSAAAFLGPTASPTHGGDVTTNGGDVLAEFSAYLPNNFLNNARAGAHVNTTSSTPYLSIPDARVLVTSQFADGTQGLSTLQFGANSALPRHVRTTGAELYDLLTWFSVDRTHHMRVTADVREDGFSQEQYVNSRGTYFYNSIADLGANRPSSFTRSFVNSDASGRALTQGFSIGDDWRPVPRATIIYGVRVDANQFLDHAPYNPLVDSAFHARTDYTPSPIDFSPRIGFFRQFGYNGTTGIPGFGAPRGNVHGGVGLFRNDVAPTLIAPGLLANGSADAVHQIQCIGSAVPAPNWSSFESNASSIPNQCADTSAQSPFASSKPNVWYVDRGFSPQHAWRGSLGINTFLIPKLVRFGLDGIYSLNLGQQGVVDRNFSGVQGFSLASEGGRPIFANASSIVPLSGALTNHDSRLNTGFGSVTALRTDLRSHSSQILLNVYPAPGDALGRFTQWNLTYVYQSVRQETRGFNGTTAGDPRDIVWGRAGNDFRHQFTASISTRVGSLFSVATTARITSGLPFTPVVNADINGDGFVNDRAFVFPLATSDTTLQHGMASLLAGASSRVRDCLQRQAGNIAARNSCEGPWTATMNAVATLNPELFRLENRAQISLGLTNVPAGLDELLHGSGHLQGWGQASASDPTLLFVRGFDPTQQRYLYSVNPRFGDTRLSRTGVRAPFLITIEARLQLGRPGLDQVVDQVLTPGRSSGGDKLSPQQIRNRVSNGVFNAVHGVLQAKDSLSFLSNDQLKQLTTLDRRVTAQGDSILNPLVEYLSALPASYNRTEVMARVLDVQVKMFDIALEGMRDAGKILSPEQINEFPPALRSAFDINRLKTIRPVAGFFPNY